MKQPYCTYLYPAVSCKHRGSPGQRMEFSNFDCGELFCLAMQATSKAWENFSTNEIAMMRKMKLPLTEQ
jgi:hypothetical protein